MSYQATPNTNHVSRPEYRSVYEPAEDTFLLLDALEQDKDELQALKPTMCVEIGSGSGCVSTFLSCLLKPVQSYILATDINIAANQCTLETSKRNNPAGIIDASTTVFTQGFVERMAGRVDVLIFNPPYVVTASDEVLHHPSQDHSLSDIPGESKLITATWAGGIRGREVVDKFWPTLKRLLSKKGVFYLVVIKENDPQEIISHLNAQYNISGKIVLSRRAGREELLIVKFVWAQ